MASVIIADDSAAGRMFVRRCFEIAGLAEATIFEAADGEQVFNHLEQHPVDLIITDLHMPRMNGMEVLQRLRQEARVIPVIVVTSAANSAVSEQLRASGASAVLRKPLSPAVALAALKQCRGAFNV